MILLEIILVGSIFGTITALTVSEPLIFELPYDHQQYPVQHDSIRSRYAAQQLVDQLNNLKRLNTLSNTINAPQGYVRHHRAKRSNPQPKKVPDYSYIIKNEPIKNRDARRARYSKIIYLEPNVFKQNYVKKLTEVSQNIKHTDLTILNSLLGKTPSQQLKGLQELLQQYNNQQLLMKDKQHQSYVNERYQEDGQNQPNNQQFMQQNNQQLMPQNNQQLMPQNNQQFLQQNNQQLMQQNNQFLQQNNQQQETKFKNQPPMLETSQQLSSQHEQQNNDQFLQQHNNLLQQNNQQQNNDYFSQNNNHFVEQHQQNLNEKSQQLAEQENQPSMQQNGYQQWYQQVPAPVVQKPQPFGLNNQNFFEPIYVEDIKPVQEPEALPLVSSKTNLEQIQAKINAEAQQVAQKALLKAQNEAYALVQAQHVAIATTQRKEREKAFEKIRQHNEEAQQQQEPVAEALSYKPQKYQQLMVNLPKISAKDNQILKPKSKNTKHVTPIANLIIRPKENQQLVASMTRHHSFYTPPAETITSKSVNHPDENAINVDDEKTRYAFGYQIKNHNMGSDFGHEEKKEGPMTKGHYHVLLPDGQMQIVNYYVDDSGYHAKVTYEKVNF